MREGERKIKKFYGEGPWENEREGKKERKERKTEDAKNSCKGEM
jgi:hypothetical protein